MQAKGDWAESNDAVARHEGRLVRTCLGSRRGPVVRRALHD